MVEEEFLRRTVRHEAGNLLQFLHISGEDVADPFEALVNELDSAEADWERIDREICPGMERAADRYGDQNRERAREVIDTTEAVCGLYRAVRDGDGSRGGEESIEVGEVVDGLTYFDDVNLEYNGLADERVAGNKGLWLIYHTVGKNYEDHAKRLDREAELFAQLSRSDGRIRAEIWDTGPGFHDAMDREELWEEGSTGGMGGYLMKEVAEVYDVDIGFSDRIDEEGIGVAYDILMQQP